MWARSGPSVQEGKMAYRGTLHPGLLDRGPRQCARLAHSRGLQLQCDDFPRCNESATCTQSCSSLNPIWEVEKCSYRSGTRCCRTSDPLHGGSLRPFRAALQTRPKIAAGGPVWCGRRASAQCGRGSCVRKARPRTLDGFMPVTIAVRPTHLMLGLQSRLCVQKALP